MSHYRTIEIERVTYRYVVGNHRTRINVVDPDGSSGGRVIGTFVNADIGIVYSEDRIDIYPSHIEKIIRKTLRLPMREYDWDKPQTKKSDPGPKTRGFRDLIGVTIADIRVSAINEVVLIAEDGSSYALESQHSVRLPGIGVISCRQLSLSDPDYT